MMPTALQGRTSQKTRRQPKPLWLKRISTNCRSGKRIFICFRVPPYDYNFSNTIFVGPGSSKQHEKRARQIQGSMRASGTRKGRTVKQEIPEYRYERRHWI